MKQKTAKRLLFILFAALVVAIVLSGCKVTERKARDWMGENRGRGAVICEEMFPVKVDEEIPERVDEEEYKKSLEDAFFMVDQFGIVNDSLIREGIRMENEIKRLQGVDTCQPLVMYIRRLEEEKKRDLVRYKERFKKAVAGIKPVIRYVPYESTRKVEAWQERMRVEVRSRIMMEGERDKWRSKAKSSREFVWYFWILVAGLVLWITRGMWMGPVGKLPGLIWRLFK